PLPYPFLTAGALNAMQPRPAIILFAAHNHTLRTLVREVLEFAGWYVKEADTIYARAMLEQGEHFDLLIIAHDVRYYSGLELTRRLRLLPHRKETPIILISLEDLADEAREAGADAFLRKPNNLIELVETIRRLLPAPAGA
ncbi:MAG TPA: response regulator, partial [Pyrinomonadaceae bacterium]|nr:response regulator [Pyrinomonadaceae bacterium]